MQLQGHNGDSNQESDERMMAKAKKNSGNYDD